MTSSELNYVQLYIHLDEEGVSLFIWSGVIPASGAFPLDDDYITVQQRDFSLLRCQVDRTEWAFNVDGTYSVHLYVNTVEDKRPMIVDENLDKYFEGKEVTDTVPMTNVNELFR